MFLTKRHVSKLGDHSALSAFTKWIRVSSLVSVLVSGAALTAVSGPAHAASLCVNAAASSGCMATIGAAVAAASPGDTINVAPGTYKESITIGKSLSLIGTDATKVIIDATG